MTASSFPISHEASNYDEVSIQQSLMFSDGLKDLKNLGAQLHSAADYFELSYNNDDQNQIVVDTLKDYAVKALVNTVDHLGSVTYKVDDLLDENVDEISRTELQVSCIEQRIRTCLQYIDHGGRSQQSLVMKTPKFHKRYILPGGETMCGLDGTKLKNQGSFIDDVDHLYQFKNAVKATIKATPPPVRKGRVGPFHHPQRSATFSFTSTMPKKDLDKRAVSPHRFPLLRSGSFTNRSVTPKSSRPTTPSTRGPTTPNLSLAGRRYPSETKKSASMLFRAEGGNGKDGEHHPSKSKRLLKALLSGRKSKKDETLDTYLDEY
ncbi:hypothetical protein SAY86_022439 [Trapa natans]|uniref:Uncharacterized protein n=1 Tax=Trapa natans TaxID=22666 RepID=A0AAN7R4G3_TRANT|nr:hypothetical protein SAY86_022439 [Trapa natans]